MRQSQVPTVRKRKSPTDEARVSPRFPLMVLEIKGEYGNRVFLGYAENISQGGLFLKARASMVVGERFPVEFVLPDHKTKVRCTCEVVWKRNYGKDQVISGGMGIKFIDLNEKIRKVIGLWVRREKQQKKR